MCLNQINLEGLIEFLKLKNDLSEIEKSILDSYKLIYDDTSSREKLIYQIQENRFKYCLAEKEIKNIISNIDENVSVKMLNELNEDDLKANLFNQALILCEKYSITKYGGKK